MTTPTALVLVDGSNMDGQARRLGARVDVAQLRTWASAYGPPRIHWFQGAYPHAVKFLNFVRSTGIRVHARTPKQLPSGAFKADCDTDLAVYGAQQVLVGGISTLVLVSGDGDFEALTRLAADHGVRVVVVSDRSCLDPALLQYAEPHDVIGLLDLPLLAGTATTAA